MKWPIVANRFNKPSQIKSELVGSAIMDGK